MIKTPEAKQLCTKTELELFSGSQSQAVKGLDEAELRKRIQRSRTARDKYRSLAQRQRREARGKQQPRGRRPSKGAQRTVRKQQLFAETLTRYQKRSAAVRGKASRASLTKKVTPQTPKKAAKKKTAAKKTAPKAKKKTKTTEPAKRKKKTATTKAAKRQKKSASRKKATKRKSSSAATSLKTKVAMKMKKPAAKTKSGELIRQRKAGSGLVRKQKHISARGKKNQARRDSRSR